MKHLISSFVVFLFMALPALAADIPCAWQNIPVDAKIGFNNQNFPKSGTGAFLTVGYQLQVPCVMSGQFTVSVTTKDTGGTANLYAFGLYYNSGGNGTVGALYSTTGEFNGSVLGSVSTGVNIPAAATAACPTYPCTLPAGVYAFGIATSCVESTNTCATLSGTSVAGNYSYFSTTQSTGYSHGLPATLSAAPIAPGPVSYNAQNSISIFVW